jgi:hypothetical protein
VSSFRFSCKVRSMMSCLGVLLLAASRGGDCGNERGTVEHRKGATQEKVGLIN